MLEGDTLFVFALPEPLFSCGIARRRRVLYSLGPDNFGVRLVSFANLSTGIKTDSDAACETLSKEI